MCLLSCRALWSVNYVEKAEKMIVSKRKAVDAAISELDGVQFFISCITGTTTNSSKQRTIRPGIAYFIAYIPTESTTEETLFRSLHNKDMNGDVAEIKPRAKGD